jgi:hypothetical protein
MGLYTIDGYVGAFDAAKVAVVHQPSGLIGRGLFIGQRA